MRGDDLFPVPAFYPEVVGVKKRGGGEAIAADEAFSGHLMNDLKRVPRSLFHLFF